MNEKAFKILVVDDEKEYQRGLSLILEDIGYQIEACSNGLEALEFLEENSVDLVITDLKMPKMDGEKFIQIAKERFPDLELIVMTAFGSIESAVDTIKIGACDYFVKSGDISELIIKVERLAKIAKLERRSNYLLENRSEELFIQSKNKKYLKVLDMCERAATTNISILLLGESGVGKEVIANYIHNKSNRVSEPFVAINCQAFPEGVIESELFGHEKGAFTGAVEKRLGKFEMANFGTLFLDEIGDLPINTQGKLLRAIESKQISKIGGNKSIDLDVRFISATNKDLTQRMSNNEFREDLFYRINALTIEIPALRDRREDVEGLISFFINKTEKDQKKSIKRVEKDVMEFLLNYNYPGNIRELKNIIERMIALSKNGIVTANDILLPIEKEKESCNCYDHTLTLKEARADFEREFIKSALLINNNNVTKTALDLGISNRQLWNKINQYKLIVK